MISVTAAEMQRLDRLAAEKYGIPPLLLMENAGRGIAEFIFRTWPSSRVTILVGKGNNGGDGLVVARHLANHGFKVFVIYVASPKQLSGDAALNAGIVTKMEIPSLFLETFDEKQISEIFQKSDLVVDALFGIGLHSDLHGIYARVIESLNQNAKTIISVDIPSGLHADTGQVMGCAIRAAHTATLGFPKKGLFLAEGPAHAGRICVIDIGLPRTGFEPLR